MTGSVMPPSASSQSFVPLNYHVADLDIVLKLVKNRDRILSPNFILTNRNFRHLILVNSIESYLSSFKSISRLDAEEKDTSVSA
jgi:hypothetical protein